MVFSSTRALEPEHLVDEDDGDTAGRDLPVDDENLVDAALDAVRRLGARVLEREGVLIDATERFLEVGHDLLGPNDKDDAAGTGNVRPELATAVGCGHQRASLGDGVNAAEHDLRCGGQAADVSCLGLTVHAPDLRADRVITPGVLDLVR